ncbi:MAG: hypothetical protein CMD22_02915, partial [Flavobacteriales bacterium]|nr:hypothetical protein [Flavobacteriales bacterium]
MVIAQTNTSPTQTVCAGSMAEPYLINPPNSGSTYQWTLSGGGTLNPGSSSDNITIDWGMNPGTYTVSVVETDVNGCLGLPVTVDVTVNSLPTATTATSQTACFGNSIPDLTAIGSNVTWYSDVNLTTQVATGNNFTTGQTAVGLYTYYVTETLNGCEGPSIPVTLEVYAVPSAPVATSQTACFTSSVPDLTATGSNITWYSDALLTVQVGTGSNFATGQTAAGIYTYYSTTKDINGCESAATTVTLEIYALPSSPSVSNQTACFGTTIPDLIATGTSIIWYSDAALTAQVGTGNNLSTGQNSVGIYTYYATTTDVNGCESIASTATLEIYALPNAPIANNEVACVGGIIPDLVSTSTGTISTWYSDASLTTVVGTGTNFATGQTAAGVYTYYVTQTNSNGCESVATTVTLTINAFNSLPIAFNVNTCFGSTVPDLTAIGVGTSFTWYDDAALTNMVGTNSPFATGQTVVGIYTYYVTETQNGCE